MREREKDAKRRARRGRQRDKRSLVAFAAMLAAALILSVLLMASLAKSAALSAGRHAMHSRIAGAAEANANTILDRAESFFAPRAYPAGHIPGSAREQAIEQIRAIREAANSAQPVWRPVTTAHAHAGAISAIVSDPTDATGKTIYVGAASGGVWKTTDGANWTPLTDNAASLMIRSLAIDSATFPATIYAGTGMRTRSGESFYGAGVLKSIDGGATWNATGSAAISNRENGVSVESLAVNPNPGTHEVVLAAVNTTASNAELSASNGVIWRSIDAGKTWAAVLHAPVGTASFIVAFDPSDASGRTAYAAIGQSSANSDRYLPCSGTVQCSGIYVSHDIGASWTRLTGLDGVADPGRIGSISLALTPQTGKETTLYVAIADASTSSANLFGIFRSVDGGATWSGVASTPEDFCAPECFDAMTLAASPSDPGVLIAGGARLYRSIDGGSTWQNMTIDRAGVALPVGEHMLAFGGDGTNFYAGTDNGVWYSPDVASSATADGSHTWRELNANSTGTGLNIDQFDAAMSAPVGPDTSGVAVQGLPNRMETSSVTDPRDSSIAYATFSGFSGASGDSLGHIFMSARHGASWRDISGNLPNIPANALVADPDTVGTLYVATDIGVFTTTNEGTTWSPFGTGLPIVPVTSLVLDEISRVLKAETYGRGVWALTLAQANPVPTITSISPTTINVGNGVFELTVSGTNFITGSVINFGNTSLTPIGNQSSTTLNAEVPTGAIATATVINVSVTNPGPGGGTSNTETFDVADYEYGTISPSIVTVTAGVTAQFQIPVIALNGFDVPLTLSCAGEPSNSTCTFNPTSITPTASGAIDNLLISTTADSAAPGTGRRPRVPPDYTKLRVPLLGAIVALFLTGVLPMRSRSRARRPRLALGTSIAGILIAGALSGCGHSSAGTAVGTYQITINAAATTTNGAVTAPIASHQVMITLIVEQTP